ncbi:MULTISPECIES: POTRA domain-containing protein [Acidobacteriaceae]|uniref:POTRA domain-containing protein n=1 Tax=Acidobacteriaceae TaxID=204434 RepID=UPI0020B149C2|nr:MULTISPECIES: POTRA domain-containing protein [Acidobacteriaceae]MDW5264450.1 POTRA domain-containing protein [Edaphobacter sp.]
MCAIAARCVGAFVLLCGLAFAQDIPEPAPIPSTTDGVQAPSAVINPLAVPQASKTETPEQAQQRINSSLADIGPGLSTTVWQWKGLQVGKIEFEGVTFDATDKLPGQLAQKAGEPFDPQKVRQSIRRLFASGRYRDVEVRGIRHGNEVTLIFAGSARYYVGRVTIVGVKSERLSSLLEYATKLNPGTALTRSAVQDGTDGIAETLQQQGYYQPKVSVKSVTDESGEQVNVTYTVDVGPQARIGQVEMEGPDPGLTLEQFKKTGRLKTGKKVNRDTTSNALTRLRSQYQKKDHLEAVVTLQKQSYIPVRKQLDYNFHANQGPVVRVEVEGVKLSKSRLHLLVPIYEEGTIDNDLLNEGVYNIRDYLQQRGYFDASVKVRMIGQDTPSERVVFTVDRGVKHKVVAVNIKGNKYFSTDLLRERMQVQKSNAYQRSGRYSPSLVTGDVNSIESLYRANGFDQAKVTTDVQDIDDAANGKPLKAAQIRVTYTVVEGRQQKFGSIDLAGVDPSRMTELKGSMNSQQGQPFSLVTLSGDRDAVLGYYLSHGFDQARIEVKQDNTADANKVNVVLNVTEGPQVFINHVLLSGIEKTKPKVVEKSILVHPGDPLDQSALLQTQRNLYNMALFNEVVTAVQNPSGDAPTKNVLVQLTEAKRWNVTYGFGFEAQTGTPSRGMISEASCIQLGIPLDQCNNFSQDGKAGISPRVSIDVSRINLRGSEDSVTLHGSYGLLEEIATLTFQNPHLFGAKNFSASVSGGYSNVQDITTFASSTLQGDFRVTEKLKRADTFIYDFQYRRVKVDPNSLQVSADLIPLLSQPVRVGGPAITWFHDTRSPSPLDAVKGSYTTIQAFLASAKFGSQTDFYKLDGTNSTYYEFGKQKYVLARSTRIGYEQASGENPNSGSPVCQGDLLTTNPSCDAVPLPERLYAGGASSHRGFGINAAGPRDLQTGFPVGGKAVFVNSFELRLPPPTLPYVGNSVSFVLFHDMGNVFQNANDMFPSFLRFHQPNNRTCSDVSSNVGTCSFNYFSHAVGVGARYKTPVGPIRVDFSYNLDPPVYPVIADFNNNPPHVGHAGHFNFFFSIGQSF